MPLLLTLFVACSAEDSHHDSGNPSAAGCDACTETEVCVGNYDFDLEVNPGDERCEPIPAECGEVVACSDTPCIAAMYDLCEEGWIGVGCSDTYPPAIVSCNPDS